MAPVLSPQLVALDVLCCAGLGFWVAAVRSLAPTEQGGARFVADFFAVLFALLLVQAYAAQASNAGALRFTMLAGLAVGAFLFQFSVAPYIVLFVQMMRFVLCEPLRIVVCRVSAPFFARVRCLFACKGRKRKKKEVEKNTQKQLQTHGDLLYNSNV